MSKEKTFILALDLGGTSFRVALADQKGEILRRMLAPTNALEGRGRVLQRINQNLREIASPVGLDAVRAIGIAAPGPIDTETGVLLTSPNMPGWENAPIRTLWKEEFRIPVYVGNDNNLAAVAEHRFGAGRGVDNLVYIAVGTGIGGGVIINGEPLIGSRGLATEVGHMTIDSGGPRCNCGNIGCLEALASGSAIARIAVQRISGGAESAITQLVEGDMERVSAEVVASVALSGDRLAKEVIEEAGSNIGIGVVNLLHIFNPQLVIIGGGVANMGEAIFKPIRRVVGERAMPGFAVPIVPSTLGDDAGLLGAIALVIDSG